MGLRSSHLPRGLPVEESPDGMIICQMVNIQFILSPLAYLAYAHSSFKQRRNLDLRQPPSSEEGIYVKNLDGTKPVNRMFGAAFQCSHVVARAHEELLKADGTSLATMRLEKAIAEISSFDATLDRLFRSCITVAATDRALTAVEVRAQWMATCPTYRAMAMWIFLKGSRIILHETHLECLEKLQVPESEVREYAAIIAESSDAVFAAVTYMTELPDHRAVPTQPQQSRGPKHIGGYYLLWPLHVIVECRFMDPARRGIARDALLKIGNEMGLNHALEIAKAVE